MKNQADTPPKSYEAALDEIQKLLSAISDTQTKLADLNLYTQRIQFLLQFCREQLRSIEKNS